MKPTLAQIREAVANYMRTEGCSCCGDYNQHDLDRQALGKLLRVKPYEDGSGFDFSRYLSKERR